MVHGFITRACVSALCMGALSLSADVVLDWNSIALDAIRLDRTSPPRASRNLAILHASMYDAVNGIRRTHEAYVVVGQVPTSASVEAAASAAVHLVLVTFFPAKVRRSTQRINAWLLRFQQIPRKKADSNGVNMWRTSFCNGAPRTAQTRMSSMPPALVPGFGSRRHPPWRPHCFRSGLMSFRSR